MVAVLATAALALGPAACGGGSSSSATGVSTVIHVPPKPRTTPKEKTAAATPKEESGKVSPKQVAGAVCPGQVGAFVGALEGLRRELEIGLSYGQYAGRVDAIRKLYDRIPVKRLSFACLGAAGTPSEHAFDRYVAAANTWNACAAKAGCGSSRIEEPLQKEWHVAAHFVKEAKRGL
jgi:hypothetical protein